MEQSVWGLSSQPLRLSDQIWREISPNKVFTTTSTQCSTKEEIPCQLVEPYSGKNLSFAYFSLLVNKFTSKSSQ